MKYHYTDSGLNNIWLANGYEVVKTNYGEGVVIHDLAGLHRAIGQMLGGKSRLTGTEVRFIRKEMELSQRGLAELMCVTDQAVAKWEKHGQIPKGADRMLRLIYLEHLNGNVPIVATISRINNTDHQNHERIIADSASGLWKLAA